MNLKLTKLKIQLFCVAPKVPVRSFWLQSTLYIVSERPLMILCQKDSILHHNIINFLIHDAKNRLLHIGSLKATLIWLIKSFATRKISLGFWRSKDELELQSKLIFYIFRLLYPAEVWLYSILECLKIAKFGITEDVIFNYENCKLSLSQKWIFWQIWHTLL